jgi:3-demethoxyubiquinol 3-hydroxylase
MFRRITTCLRRRKIHLGHIHTIEQEVTTMPKWLVSEMRSNHAGEYGAVQIYNGAKYGLKLHEQLNIFIDDYPVHGAIEFVTKHKKAEQIHLTIMESMLSKEGRTSLIPLWHLAGFALGFLPSVLGPRALYWTVAAVETFVEEHYGHQIQRLLDEGDRLPKLRERLETFCQDEVHHKEEAVDALLLGTEGRDKYEDETLYVHLLEKSLTVRMWTSLIIQGSRIAVRLSKIY